MYIYKWIEGEDNLDAFCLKRFGERPRFVETIGRVSSAKVYLIYKWREDKQDYTSMFLLFMEHTKGTTGDITNIQHQTYGQIRANKSSLLIR